MDEIEEKLKEPDNSTTKVKTVSFILFRVFYMLEMSKTID